MIRALVESAFTTGCFSVESEGLLYQVLATKSYQSKDLVLLASLYDAVKAGSIKREAPSNLVMEFPLQRIKQADTADTV
ncbi:hypothetical protein G7B40_028035 [Aetokthonos hydrillicola Thurmond2011]|jgi:hypothetical protein|uniref:Uncharacterized protein n=1 Tax=Aetokthonos hydrillicola Thurmond2011 TaxID=2712845 RepID=A0AAP5IG19_9CYAN|nr:hypothetical protein [Aetokthonos hydrillicola]MBO3462551.1 hypothetical protein [Aetokthonos hydrillicola CCALA 1050]MBW4589810.1 hypothetical protein [Aetokthonos hydrillicola CCALA 1050]MDR9898380.1 hypothetical protein [Aetokthonos hydrillicola Thurmond2011]